MSHTSGLCYYFLTNPSNNFIFNFIYNRCVLDTERMTHIVSFVILDIFNVFQDFTKDILRTSFIL